MCIYKFVCAFKNFQNVYFSTTVQKEGLKCDFKIALKNSSMKYNFSISLHSSLEKYLFIYFCTLCTFRS